MAYRIVGLCDAPVGGAIPGSRHGVTLTELLTVMAVIGLLVALLIPAVQSAREAARRTQCRSNLRQIGLTIHNYEASFGAFPACGVKGISWQVSILPYIEQRAVYEKLEYGSADPVATIRPTPIHSYLCPSDPAPDVSAGAVHIAAPNYLGNSGTGTLVNGTNGVFQHFVSPFPARYTEGPVRAADITDGLSQTAAVSECLHSIGGAQVERLRIVWNLPDSYAPSRVNDFLVACSSIPAEPAISGWHGSPIAHGYDWTLGDIGDSTYNHMLGPMQPSCYNGTSTQDGIFSAGSGHQPSTNVLFADGHVVSVAPNIDLKIWSAIGSRNGSETIESAF